MSKEIPLLTARDVELRVQKIDDKEKYVVLLAYKDARVDMRILDEVFGPGNWKRGHEIIGGQLFCTVSIWDEEKQQWITKQDVGTESKTEAEKGRASDSFKRACFNVGIGRELYDVPYLKIKVNADELSTYNGRTSLKGKFYVRDMQYDKAKGEFTKFVVVDAKGTIRYSKESKSHSDTVKVEPEPAPVAKSTKPVIIEGDKCKVYLNRGYKYLDKVSGLTLMNLRENEAYKEAWDAIECELNVRDLQGGK